MNTLGKVPSTPLGVARRPLGKLLFGLLAGGAVILSAVGFGIWLGSDSDQVVPARVPRATLDTSEEQLPERENTRRFYIVGNPELAGLLQKAIDEANVHGRLEGAPYVPATVVVASTEGEADQLKAAFVYGNRILVGLGIPENVVIDLRGD